MRSSSVGLGLVMVLNLPALVHCRHYESQCLPTPLAFYFHHLPPWVHQASVLATYFIEIILPFLFFIKLVPCELLTFGAQLLLMGLICATG